MSALYRKQKRSGRVRINARKYHLLTCTYENSQQNKPFPSEELPSYYDETPQQGIETRRGLCREHGVAADFEEIVHDSNSAELGQIPTLRSAQK